MHLKFYGFYMLMLKIKKKNHFDSLSIKKHFAPHYQIHI
jgi:hypothetical protein